MNRAIKIRIYPDKEQRIQIEKTIGCSRFIYNQMLADKISYYQKEKKMLRNTPAGYKKEYPWLKEVDSLALANVKNSRIRQGLSLTAPIYQPGHKTKVFFRVTNITKKIIKLNLEKGIAYLLFLPLGESVEKPYNGTFQNEETFVGMGAYQSALGDDMIDIEKKVDAVKNIEKNVYGNVLSIMGIFIGIFSLINVNLSLVAASAGMATLLTFNFATVGAIAFLIGLINAILPDGKNHKLIWCASGLAFLASIVVQFIVK